MRRWQNTRITRLYQNNKAWIRNLVLYGIIGALAALVDFGSFYLMNTGLSWNRYAANIVSMHLGMLVSFSLNTKVNFQKTDKLWRRFLSYYIIILGGMGLSSLILWIGSFVTDSSTIVKAFAVVFVAAVQFVFNKFVTYRD